MTQKPTRFIRGSAFFHKLVGAFLLVVTLPVAGLSVYNFIIERRNATADALASLSDISQRIASDIDKYIVTNQNLIQHIALNAELQDFFLASQENPGQSGAFNQWLRIQSSISQDFSALYVLDKSGNCLASTEASFIGENYSVRRYFRKAINGEVFQSDWSIGLTSDVPGIYLSAPIVHANEIVGVVVLKMRVDRIVDIVNIWRYQDQDGFLINSAGIVLAHTRPELAYRSLMELPSHVLEDIKKNQQFSDRVIQSLDLPKIQKAVDALLANRQTDIVNYRFEDQPKFASLSGLKERNWVAGIAVPEAAIYSQSNLVLRNTLVFSLLSLTVAVVVALLLSRVIARPIIHLTDRVNRFAAGQTGVRVDLESNDEVGELAISFNRMADTIQQHTEGLEQKVLERTRALEELNQQLHYLSVRDTLTGGYNRRYLNTHLPRELARAKRYGHWLTLIMFDIDHFKQVNDHHGHRAGDRVLQTCGELLRGLIREQTDWIVRYGGEEFLLVLPETPPEGAVHLAERLRITMESTTFHVHDQGKIRCTGSFGVLAVEGTHARAQNLDADRLITSVDALLYQAKHAGRNRVVAQTLGQAPAPMLSVAGEFRYN